MRKPTLFLLLLAGLMFLGTTPLHGQTASITGTITDAASGEPIAGVRVEAISAAGRAVGSTISGPNGRFSLTGLPEGSYSLLVSRLAYETVTTPTVSASSSTVAVITVQMKYTAFELDPVVVSASRGVPEKAVSTPAMVELVGPEAIAARAAVSPADHLRSLPGVDIITQGVQSTNVVARGFNNIFSTSLHTLTDYRVASIPSLRVNLLHFIPANNEDIERMELVLGPGSALYGPNTANGVLHIMTRSPLDEQGTVVSLASGLRASQSDRPSEDNKLSNRGVFLGNFRTSHLLSDNFGVKLSGQFLEGQEWRHNDPVEDDARRVWAVIDPSTRIGLRDFSLRRVGAEARADWRVDERTTAIFSAGYTNSLNGIELTGIGAGQTKGWSYTYLQARARRDRLFGQVYVNMSDAGDTYILRNGLQIVDNSKVVVGQLQHGRYLTDRINLIYGADVVGTLPDTRGTIHGRNESDDRLLEAGAYLQSETRLDPRLNLVLAGRVDHHSRLDHKAIFSPRAALVFSPVERHSVRLTYNRAFSTPVSFNLFLDLDAGPAPGLAGEVLGYRVRAMGTEPGGFTFQRSDGSLAGMRSPFTVDAGLGSHSSALLDVSSTNLWRLAVAAAARLGRIDGPTAASLLQLSPTEQDIAINVRNPTSGLITPLAQTTGLNVPRVQESLNSMYEVGYRGILSDNVLINGAVWHERRSNFVSPLSAQSPLLQVDSAGTYDFAFRALTAAGAPQAVAAAQAQQLAAGLSSLPAAVVSSAEVNASAADILASYRNFGHVSLTGVDLSVQTLFANRWSLTVGGSVVDKDHFTTGGFLVGLNAPKLKGTAALQYRDGPLGLNGELRVRHTGEFPVASAPTSATRCLQGRIPNEFFEEGECIKATTLADLNLGWNVPRLAGASMQLSVTNLFDTPYRSFVDVPAIGRFAMLRVRYAF